MKNGKKKIFLVIPSLWSGGAEKIVVNLALQLDNERFSVAIVCLYDTNKCKEQFLMELAKHNIKIHFLNKKTGFDIKAIWKLYKLIKKERPDIIHSHLHAGIYVYLTALMCKQRFIHTVHTLAEYEMPNINRKIMATAYKTKRAFPIAISEAVRLSLLKVYSKEISEIELIYNGAKLQTDTLHVEQNGNKVRLVSIGRLTHEKNTELMLQVFFELSKRHDGISLNILGEGELKEEIENSIKKHKLVGKVKLLGFVGDIYTELQKSDIFIFTSIYEGFGLVIVEAMSAGLPIVSSGVGAIPELVRDGIDGYIFESGNLADAVAKLDVLINNESLRREMGDSAKKRAAEFDIDIMVKKYEELYSRF